MAPHMLKKIKRVEGFKYTFNPSISNSVISRKSRITPESGIIIRRVPLRLKPPMQVASLYSIMFSTGEFPYFYRIQHIIKT